MKQILLSCALAIFALAAPAQTTPALFSRSNSFGPADKVAAYVTTNHIVPDNLLSFTNLQTAINVCCSNYGGGTITLGTGDFYSPAGFFFPSNVLYSVRITGQSGASTRVEFDTNGFTLAFPGGGGPAIILDHLGLFAKTNGPGMIFNLSGDSKNEVSDCWLARYADLFDFTGEWILGGVKKNATGVMAGFLGGDNFNRIRNNIIVDLAGGFLLLADHYRIEDNEFSLLSRALGADVDGDPLQIRSNLWSVADNRTVLAYNGKLLKGKDFSLGACYTLADNGDTQISGDHLFAGTTGFFLTAKGSDEYAHRHIHDEVFEDVDQSFVVADNSVSAAPAGAFAVQYDNNYWNQDFWGLLPHSSPFFSLNESTYAVTQTQNAPMQNIIGDDMEPSARGQPFVRNYRVAGLPVLSINSSNHTVTLTNTYVFAGNGSGLGSLNAAALTGNVPLASITGGLQSCGLGTNHSTAAAPVYMLAGNTNPPPPTLTVGPGANAVYFTNIIPTDSRFEVCIVGTNAAGFNALTFTLNFGTSLRNLPVCSAGIPQNMAAGHMQGLAGNLAPTGKTKAGVTYAFFSSSAHSLTGGTNFIYDFTFQQ